MAGAPIVPPGGIDNVLNIYDCIAYIQVSQMALSIRNKDAERLAREVARETGESITEAILNSLQERLLRLSGRRVAVDLSQEIMRIAGRCAALPDVDTRRLEEILGYDADGIPR